MRSPWLVVALAALVGAGCEPVADDLDFDRQEVPVFERASKVPTDPSPRRLKVMVWNVKFGAARVDFWFDYWGDRVQMTPSEVATNLAGIERLIREVDPDVVLAGEVDVSSRRSAYVDMVEHVLEHTSLNYAAYFGTWNSRYVPSEGLGRIDMGNVIWSKHPISFAERIRQADRTDQDGLTRTFYLHRMIGRAILQVGAREVAAYVVHTEAYDKDGTKQKQIRQVEDEVSRETRPFVLGGDFNELPPTAVKLEDFDDEHPRSKGTEFEQPPYTPEVMTPFYARWSPAIPLDRIGTTEASQRPYYTHTVRGPNLVDASGQPGFWNRTLDHLFVGNGGAWVAGSTDVLQGPGRLGITSDPLWLSDHAPVVGTWELPP